MQQHYGVAYFFSFLPKNDIKLFLLYINRLSMMPYRKKSTIYLLAYWTFLAFKHIKWVHFSLLLSIFLCNYMIYHFVNYKTCSKLKETKGIALQRTSRHNHQQFINLKKRKSQPWRWFEYPVLISIEFEDFSSPFTH